MKKICKVDGCEKQSLARGWCQRHYDSWRLRGDPMAASKVERSANRTCIAENCTRKATKRGLCDKHYRRWARTGSPSPLPRIAAESELRTEAVRKFLMRVKVNHKTGCWLLPEGSDLETPGKISYNGRNWRGYEFYYKVYQGLDLPDGLELAHVCREHGCDRNRRSCCNHVRAVNHAENMRMDMCGDQNPAVKVPDFIAKQALNFYESDRKITYKDTALYIQKLGYEASADSVRRWNKRGKRFISD